MYLWFEDRKDDMTCQCKKKCLLIHIFTDFDSTVISLVAIFLGTKVKSQNNSLTNMHTKTNNYNKKNKQLAKKNSKQQPQQAKRTTITALNKTTTVAPFCHVSQLSGLENDLTLEPMMVHLPVELLWRSLGRPDGQGDKVKVADAFIPRKLGHTLISHT